MGHPEMVVREPKSERALEVKGMAHEVIEKRETKVTLLDGRPRHGWLFGDV
jgi:hypothetical protein